METDSPIEPINLQTMGISQYPTVKMMIQWSTRKSYKLHKVYTIHIYIYIVIYLYVCIYTYILLYNTGKQFFLAIFCLHRLKLFVKAQKNHTREKRVLQLIKGRFLQRFVCISIFKCKICGEILFFLVFSKCTMKFYKQNLSFFFFFKKKTSLFFFLSRQCIQLSPKLLLV